MAPEAKPNADTRQCRLLHQRANMKGGSRRILRARRLERKMPPCRNAPARRPIRPRSPSCLHTMPHAMMRGAIPWQIVKTATMRDSSSGRRYCKAASPGTILTADAERSHYDDAAGQNGRLDGPSWPRDELRTIPRRPRARSALLPLPAGAAAPSWRFDTETQNIPARIVAQHGGYTNTPDDAQGTDGGAILTLSYIICCSAREKVMPLTTRLNRSGLLYSFSPILKAR